MEEFSVHESDDTAPEDDLKTTFERHYLHTEVDEMMESRMEGSIVPVVGEVHLPRDPSTPLPTSDTFLSQAQHASTLIVLNECRALANVLVTQLSAMAKNPDNRKLFSSDSWDLSPGEKIRQERVYELSQQLQNVLEDVRKMANQLTRHAQRRLEVANQEKERDTVDAKHTVPIPVYNYLKFLEARNLQRMRQHQFACGLPHMATFRQWRRKLYSNLRARIYSFKNRLRSRLEEGLRKVTNQDERVGQPLLRIVAGTVVLEENTTNNRTFLLNEKTAVSRID